MLSEEVEKGIVLCPTSSSCMVTVSTFTSSALPVTSCFDSLVPSGTTRKKVRKVQVPCVLCVFSYCLMCVCVCVPVDVDVDVDGDVDVCVCVSSVSPCLYFCPAKEHTGRELEPSEQLFPFAGNFLPILQVIRANHLSFSLHTTFCIRV